MASSVFLPAGEFSQKNRAIGLFLLPEKLIFILAVRLLLAFSVLKYFKMCESNAYFKQGDKEELFLKDVILMEPISEKEWRIENLLGEQKTFRGKIKRIDFSAHKILLEPEE